MLYLRQSRAGEHSIEVGIYIGEPRCQPGVRVKDPKKVKVLAWLPSRSPGIGTRDSSKIAEKKVTEGGGGERRV